MKNQSLHSNAKPMIFWYFSFSWIELIGQISVATRRTQYSGFGANPYPNFMWLYRCLQPARREAFLCVSLYIHINLYILISGIWDWIILKNKVWYMLKTRILRIRSFTRWVVSRPIMIAMYIQSSLRTKTARRGYFHGVALAPNLATQRTNSRKVWLLQELGLI